MLAKRFRQLKPHVSERTIKTYVSNVKRLRKISPLLEYGPISEFLKTKSPSQAANLLTAVIVLEGPERFGKLYKTLNNEAESIRGNQKFTSNEINNWVGIRQIREGINRLKWEVQRLELLKPKKHKKHELTLLIQYFILSFYNEYHWRNNLVSVRLGKHVGQNYYYDGKFYLNKFKTASKFKSRGLLPVVYTPSRKLKKLINQFIAVREAQDVKHDYLLFNRSLKPINPSAFYETITRATKRWIGKAISVSMLRHIFVTRFLARNPSLHEKKKFLRSLMQLNLETLESYGRRGDDGKLKTDPF